MIDPTEIIEPEWLEWYALTPAERFSRTAEMWDIYRSYGGTLAPDPDTQSPFFDPEEWLALFGNGRTGLRIVRRS